MSKKNKSTQKTLQNLQQQLTAVLLKDRAIQRMDLSTMHVLPATINVGSPQKSREYSIPSAIVELNDYPVFGTDKTKFVLYGLVSDKKAAQDLDVNLLDPECLACTGKQLRERLDISELKRIGTLKFSQIKGRKGQAVHLALNKSLCQGNVLGGQMYLLENDIGKKIRLMEENINTLVALERSIAGSLRVMSVMTKSLNQLFGDFDWRFTSLFSGFCLPIFVGECDCVTITRPVTECREASLATLSCLNLTC